jgi:uncharacterized protein involved in outer membrane biogenesis
MKRLTRWLFRLLILAIVLLVALALLKDTVLKGLIERQVRLRTGLTLTIRTLDASLFSPVVRMDGARLFNPPDFGGSAMIEVPEVSFEYDLAKALTGSLRLRLLRLHLGEIGLVRNAAGQTNLPAMLPGINGSADRAPGLPSPLTNAPAQGRSQWRFEGIDHLYLSLGSVRFTDLAQPARNWIRPVGWEDYEIKNIRTAAEAWEWARRVLFQVTVPPARTGPSA